MHPSRAKKLTGQSNQDSEQATSSRKPGRKGLTIAEKAALEEEKQREKERSEKERQKSIRQREKRRRDMRKMTRKGQPVLNLRIPHLLQRVKKSMKEEH